MNKEWVYHIDKSKRMSSEPLHKAFREHGVHNFMIKELDEYNDNLTKRMNYWIEKYNPEYNPAPIINTEKEDEPMQVLQKPVPEPKKKTTYRSPHLQSFNEHTRADGKHFGLRIKGKNLETGEVKEYESARVAALEITGNARNNSNILLAARTGRKAYNHKWQLLEEKKKKKPIFGVNKKTELIEVRYESIAAAKREYGENAGIARSLKNPGRYSYKGYYWFYG